MFLACLCAAFREEKENKRIVLKIPNKLAPIKVAIFPLTKTPLLINIANNIYDEIKMGHNCFYEEKDSIGKRYRRQDAIGTPFCITIDDESLNDNKVTIRERDSMKQERIEMNKIKEYINNRL